MSEIIDDPNLAETMAYAEKPYRELASKAEETGPKSLATKMLNLAEIEGEKAKFSREGLFADGTWEADPAVLDSYFASKEESYREWAEHTREDDPDSVEKLMELERADLFQQRTWLEQFSGKIPQSWAIPEYGAGWHNVLKTFEQAGSAQLDRDLLDAAVAHWHPAVVQAVATHQRLDVLQLGTALHNPNYLSHEDILKAQRDLGVDDRTIRDALAIQRILDEEEIDWRESKWRERQETQK